MQTHQMEVEVGQKSKAAGAPPKGKPTEKTFSNEKGDVIKQRESQCKQKAAPATTLAFTKQNTTTKTKSKAELTHKEQISQECTQRQVERLEELKREQRQNDENAEVLGIPLPFRSVGQRSSLTNLHDLLQQCPQPQPPLIKKHLKSLQLNAEQAIIMAEQVKKMKTGMERLQDIIKKFNCTEKFKQDIDFIIANVGPAITRAEQGRKSQHVITNMDDN